MADNAFVGVSDPSVEPRIVHKDRFILPSNVIACSRALDLSLVCPSILNSPSWFSFYILSRRVSESCRTMVDTNDEILIFSMCDNCRFQETFV